MNYQDNQFITAESLSWKGVLQDVSKSKSALQPVFEAFTNALEAIKIRQLSEPEITGNIKVKVYTTETTVVGDTQFSSLSITDNGIGFNDKEFKRFNTYKLSDKGFKNLGSGRIQYVHHFNSTKIKSIYKNDDKFFEREFVVSKDVNYLKHNAIVQHIYCKETTNSEIGTFITFYDLRENSQIYNGLNEKTLKGHFLERYIHHFCYNKQTLPNIEIEFYIQTKFIGKETISRIDIPDIDKTDKIPIPYSKLSKDAKSIETTDKKEDFTIDAFRISRDTLKSNDLKLVSKGEIVEKSDIILQCLSEKDIIDGNRYLFLVSSHYIDDKDTDTRGVLNIPNADSFSKNISLFTHEAILMEQIQSGIDESITRMYNEIEVVKQKHNTQLERLKEMFLLDNETATAINISVNDTESKILEKFYEVEAKKEATIDASIKESIDRLEALNTTSENYYKELEKEIQHLVKAIPQQNKITLTHYVARRKIVLELFKKILDKETLVQKKIGRNIDEKLLHNLIFQQSQSNPENSDLWLINEDFIYFKGTSEDQLKEIKVDGVKLLRSDLTPEEEEFRLSLGENRYINRPDILLFPQENKCIIIEFKNPDVNVSEHLTQINNYATLIWNFADNRFKINTFYGYLIGEKIHSMDVRAHDGDYIEAYNFDYLFRPFKKIPGFFQPGDASLYTEVIKYSTLLERASNRNEIFIKKLSQ